MAGNGMEGFHQTSARQKLTAPFIYFERNTEKYKEIEKYKKVSVIVVFFAVSAPLFLCFFFF